MKKQIHLVCATKAEWSPLKKIFSNKRIPSESKLPIYQLISDNYMNLFDIYLHSLGIGIERAQLLDENFLSKANLVLHFGISGGLTPDLKVGDLMCAEKIIFEESQPVFLKNDFHEKIKSHSKKINFGTLLTSKTVLSKPKDKTDAFYKTNAIAVDMESYQVAYLCQKNKIPYFSIRSIFDTCDFDLSHLESSLVKENGKIDLKNLGLNFVKNPKLLMSLPLMQKKLEASRKPLIEFLEFFLNGAI